MTPTFFKNKKGIRASFVNWRTTKADIEIVIEEMNRILKINKKTTCQKYIYKKNRENEKRFQLQSTNGHQV